jgi:restriction endonuclease S subunit
VKFLFRSPPLPEQHRIVGILDEAFSVLATAKANAEKNLQNARALFESHLQSVFSQLGKGWVEMPFAAIYQQKLAALEALKKSLLHQAFSGEL